MFTKAKQLLCQDCMLMHYDINKPLKLFSDASPYGLGACLVHVMPNGDERSICKCYLVTHVIPIRIVYIFSRELKMADKDPVKRKAAVSLLRIS